MVEYIEKYIEHIKEDGYSEGSIDHKRRHIKQFIEWCKERGIEKIEEISREDVDRYRKHLYYYRDSKEKALSFGSQSKRLSDIHRFLGYLKKLKIIEKNPAEGVDFPRQTSCMPEWLSKEEIEKIIAGADTTQKAGRRDRCILELMYATGIRREELGALEVSDIDFEKESVRICRERKVRIVPVLKRTLKWLKIYIEQVRPKLLGKKGYKDLFLTYRGIPYICRNLTKVVQRYKHKTGIKKKGDFVLFRHSVIRMLIEGGMDARYIQEMMGLGKLEQIQGYSTINLKKLKEVHEKTHPGNKKN